MPTIRNKANGPRIVHVREGETLITVTLDPGKIIEGELAFPEGKVERAMIEAGDLELNGEPDKAQMRALTTNPDDPAGPEAVMRAALDQDRRTPPKMFGGDGGPAQMPTVDNRDGALTRPQQEGAMSRQDAEKADEERRAELRKAEEALRDEEQKAQDQQAPQGVRVTRDAQVTDPKAGEAKAGDGKGGTRSNKG
jgi:hypothetical protein